VDLATLRKSTPKISSCPTCQQQARESEAAPTMGDFEDVDWGEFTESQGPAPSPALYSNGQQVEYRHGSGVWVPTQVISVDLTVSPPSYCIKLENGSRETEEWRLRKLEIAAAPQILPYASPPAATTSDSLCALDCTIVDSEGLDSFRNHNATDHPISEDTMSHHPLGSRPTPKYGNGGSGDGVVSCRQYLKHSAPEVAHRTEKWDYMEEVGTIHGTITATQDTAEQKQREGPTDDQAVPAAFGSTRIRRAADAGCDDEEDNFGDFQAASHSPDQSQDAAVHDAAEGAGQSSCSIAEVQRGPASTSTTTDSHRSHSPVVDVLVGLPPPRPPPAVWHYSPGSNKMGMERSSGFPQRVHEYGTAWLMILDRAATILHHGKELWETSTSPARSHQNLFIQDYRVQQYLAGLGKVYLVAGLVRLAAEQSGLMHVVPELQKKWARCHTAWTISVEAEGDGGESDATSVQLRKAVMVAAGTLGVPLAEELGAVEAASVTCAAMSLDEFPRMLAWCEGLDALTLLPLSVFKSLRHGRWGGDPGRACMVCLANFWMFCVSQECPELD